MSLAGRWLHAIRKKLTCIELQDLKVIQLQPAQAKALDLPDRQGIVCEAARHQE